MSEGPDAFVRRWRLERGLEQRDLAAMLDVNPYTVSR